MGREYFNAYHSYLQSMSHLSDAECGRLFRALLKYSATGEPGDKLIGNERFVADGMISQIDRDKKRYEEKSNQNRENIMKRWQSDDIRTNTTVYENIRPYTNVCKEKETEREMERETEKEREMEKKKKKETEDGPEAQASAETGPPENRGGASAPEKRRYADHVLLTESEYQKLVARHGESAVRRMIGILDHYKGENDKRYKSDYHAILNWVVGRYAEEQKKRSPEARPTGAMRENSEQEWTDFFDEGYDL